MGRQNYEFVFQSPCIQVQYMYFISSLNINDIYNSRLPQAMDVVGMLAKLFQGDINFMDSYSDNDQQKKLDFEIS